MADPIRYYFDQHVYGAVAAGLSHRGIAVLTAQQPGRCGLPDTDQLAFALAEGRVMVSFDSDYLALHNGGCAHEGIAWCPAAKYSIGPLIQMLELLHAVADRAAMRGRVEYL